MIVDDKVELGNKPANSAHIEQSHSELSSVPVPGFTRSALRALHGAPVVLVAVGASELLQHPAYIWVVSTPSIESSASVQVLAWGGLGSLSTAPVPLQCLRGRR